MAWSRTLFHENRKRLETVADRRISDALEGVAVPPECLLAEGNNLLLDGAPLYQPDAAQSATQQAAHFIAAPQRISITTGARSQENSYNFSTLVCSALENEANRFSAHALPEPQFQEVGALVSFGLGLGGHLEPLTRALNFQNLILIEPHLDFLIASLGVLDWSPIIDAVRAREGLLYFIFDDNPNSALSVLTATLRDRPFAQLEGSYLYTHYGTAFFETLARRFSEYGENILSYNGWIEDEVLHVQNHSANTLSLESQQHQLFLYEDRPLNSENGAAVICGSGPSLTQEIDLLKAHRDRFTLFSAGTSLGPLLQAGIRPDFHCELENTNTVRDILTKTQAEFGFEGITLLASTTVDPDVKSLFETCRFFIREGDGLVALASGRVQAVPLVGPSCVNTATQLSTVMGFGPLFFLGTDFGVPREGSTYAKGVAYEAIGVINEERREQGYISVSEAGSTLKQMSSSVPAARGGSISTNPLLTFMRHRLESQLAHLNINAYNLSSGADIAGAPFCLAERFAASLSQAKQPNRDAAKTRYFEPIETLIKGGVLPDRVESEALADDLDRFLQDLHGSIRGAITQDLNTSRVLLAAIKRYPPCMAGLITSQKTEAGGIKHAFEGSILPIFHVIRHLEARMEPADRPSFIKRALEILCEVEPVWPKISCDRIRARLEEIDSGSVSNPEIETETDFGFFQVVSTNRILPISVNTLEKIKSLLSSHPVLHDICLIKYLTHLTEDRVEAPVFEDFHAYFFEAIRVLPPPGALLSLSLKGLARSYRRGVSDDALSLLLEGLKPVTAMLTKEDRQNLTKLRALLGRADQEKTP